MAKSLFEPHTYAIYNHPKLNRQMLIYLIGRFPSRMVGLRHNGDFSKKWYYDANHVELIETNNEDIPIIPQHFGGIKTIPEENLQQLESILSLTPP